MSFQLPEIAAYWYWFALSVLLMTLEIVVPGFIIIWLGIGAGAAGFAVLLFPAMSWHFPAVIFALTSIASIVLWRRYSSTRQKKTDRPLLNQRAQRYIGHTVPLTTAVHQGSGKIKIDDTVWLAKSSEDMAEGKLVTVTGFEFGTFIVEPAEIDSSD